jgi:hypothetical protein
MKIASTPLLVMTFVAACTMADAHSWYPQDCCSDGDCTAVDAIEHPVGEDMIAVVGSHRIPIPKSIVPRVSPDGRMHVCFREDPYLRIDIPVCVFLPPES